MTANARPFIKNVGGKTQLLPELLKRVPSNYGTYFEVFIGGGALFWALEAARPPTPPHVLRTVLNDNDKQLMETYASIRDAVDHVIACLQQCETDYRKGGEVYYYLHRDAHNTLPMLPAQRAASVIFLSKTGFNGLRRVNKSGGFNVPHGKYTNPTICDEANLRACSHVLQTAALVCADFQKVMEPAKAGDFAYFDPPYAPLNATSNFTSYTATGFGPADQRRLRDVALELKRRGVHVLLSNSSAPLIRTLYADGFKVEEVQARRAINSKASARGAVTELLIT